VYTVWIRSKPLHRRLSDDGQLGAVLSTELLVAFVDSVRERFGVEPVCQVPSQVVCKIAPSTYYAAKSRRPSARDLSGMSGSAR
jgi:hypothetical protein